MSNVYYCRKCRKQHKKSSQIGKQHKKHKNKRYRDLTDKDLDLFVEIQHLEEIQNRGGISWYGLEELKKLKARTYYHNWSYKEIKKQSDEIEKEIKELIKKNPKTD
jgi:hypothetical protein